MKLWRKLFALATAALAFCAQPALAKPAIPQCSGTRWIVNGGSLLRASPAFPAQLQHKQFDSTCTFLVTAPGTDAQFQGWRAIRTRSFTSLAGLAAAVADPSVGAVLYDPEGWQLTPPDEQRDPAAAACKVAEAAHARGKLVVVTPAVTLLRALTGEPGTQGERYERFVQTNVARKVAACADVYEIQAQGAEMRPEKFRQFVEAEATQARQANPAVLVLAGISTNPNGQKVGARQVYDAVMSVRGLVDGYWLNIPAGGKYCPQCGEPQPQVATGLFELLAAESARN